MPVVENQIFLGCNYGNSKVKSNFDNLKIKLEKEYPVRVVLIDRENAPGASDLWSDIKQAISSSSLAIFDVSAFRPNVVLELGYALAVIDQESILISFDERRPKDGAKPDWLLSDISHLRQIRYKVMATLHDKIAEHLQIVPMINRYNKMVESIDANEGRGNRYKEIALKCLTDMRDNGSLHDRMIEAHIDGTTVDFESLKWYLRNFGLATRGRGHAGRWNLCI